MIEQKLGPAGLEAADEIAQQVNQAGLLYDPDVDPEQVRVALRAAAEVGRAQERTGNVWETVRAIGEEMKRTYGPAGDDASRERSHERGGLVVSDRGDPVVTGRLSGGPFQGV